jgi:hypothetical protein
MRLYDISVYSSANRFIQENSPGNYHHRNQIEHNKPVSTLTRCVDNRNHNITLDRSIQKSRFDLTFERLLLHNTHAAIISI